MPGAVGESDSPMSEQEPTPAKLEAGWMAEKPMTSRVYHYIGGEGRSLCGRYGFYSGELMADQGKPERGREDCAECFRRLRGKAQATPAPGPPHHVFRKRKDGRPECVCLRAKDDPLHTVDPAAAAAARQLDNPDSQPR